MQLGETSRFIFKDYFLEIFSSRIQPEDTYWVFDDALKGPVSSDDGVHWDTLRIQKRADGQLKLSISRLRFSPQAMAVLFEEK
jgi:hypothetical protein